MKLDMIHPTRMMLGVAVLAALLALPEASRAAGIGLRNETNVPILVQGASIVNGMIRRSQPFGVGSGQIGWDLNLDPGPRQITVYDATRPNRILFQGVVRFQGKDMFFLIRPSPQPAQFPLTLVPHVPVPAPPVLPK
jgi:hypothetical protein